MLLGNGNGTFQAKQAFGIGTEPYLVAVGDFNGDGKSDLVTAGYNADTAAFCSATATVHFRLSMPLARETGLSQVRWRT